MSKRKLKMFFFEKTIVERIIADTEIGARQILDDMYNDFDANDFELIDVAETTQ